MSYPSHPPCLHHRNKYLLKRTIYEHLIMLHSLASGHVVPLRPKYSLRHPFLRHTQYMTSVSVKDQVPQLYKTRSKFMGLNISVLKFIEKRQEDKRFLTV
jgi:hypothetical protein